MALVPGSLPKTTRLDIPVTATRRRASGCARWPVTLLAEDFLHLADLLLNSAGHFFNYAFRLQVGILCQFPDLLLHRSLYLVNPACCLILATWLHDALLCRHAEGPACHYRRQRE